MDGMLNEALGQVSNKRQASHFSQLVHDAH